MKIYYNVTKQCLVDELNSRTSVKPVINFGEKPQWELWLYGGETGQAPEPEDVSSCVSWRAAIDDDWDKTTPPMCRTVDGIEKSRAADGVLLIPLNANTVTYAEALGTKKEKTGYFELRGFDVSGNVARILFFDVLCRNAVDPDGGGEPEEVGGDLASRSWTRAVLAQALVWEYSSDGENWHANCVNHVDQHQRVKHGADGTWSATMPIPYGRDGLTVVPDAVGKIATRPETAAEGTCFAASDEGKCYWFIGGVWTDGVPLTTVPGPVGADGKEGRQGKEGPQGKQGIQGSKGNDGGQGKQGIQGLQGKPGDGLAIDATGTLANRHNYDAADRGFRYMATDLCVDPDNGMKYQLWYQKTSGDLGAWSAGIRLYCGAKGDIGETGQKGDRGERGLNGENASVSAPVEFGTTAAGALEIVANAVTLNGTKPIASVEFYFNDPDDPGEVKSRHSTHLTTIDYCYTDNRTHVYFTGAGLDPALGGRIRFAQGIGGVSPYQEYLNAGGTDDYLSWYENLTGGGSGGSGTGGGGTGGEEEPTGVMYYGYIASQEAGAITSVTRITPEIIAAARTAGTLTGADASAAGACVMANVPAYSWIVAILPATLSARKDDGLGGKVAFSVNNGATGSGANGSTLTLGDATYKVYGELQIVTAQTTIYIEEA